jgi:hypothetical protein
MNLGLKKNCINSDVMKAGNSIVLTLWVYKSSTKYRRITKKDLTYRGRRFKAVTGKYLLTFLGKCIKFTKKTNIVKLRSYFFKESVNFFFFLNAPNIIFVGSAGKYRQFKNLRKSENCLLKSHKLV